MPTQDDTTIVNPARKAVPRRLRFEVLRRDNHTCRYCGASAPDVKLAVDHVVPVVLGGTNDPTNLVTACVDCNAGKSSVSASDAIVDEVAADALRWAKAMEHAAHLQRMEASRLRVDAEYLVGQWDEITSQGWSRSAAVPADGLSSIIAFRNAGLELHTIERMMEVAATNQTIPNYAKWRYFCGCCWKTLDDRRTVARGLIDSGTV